MQLLVSLDGVTGCSVVTLRRDHDVMMPDDARAALELAGGLGCSGFVTQKTWRVTNGVRELWAQRVYRVTPGGERLVEGVPYGY